MFLRNDILNNLQALTEKGYACPAYDVNLIRENTKSRPQWVHFGPGNIFRAHIAAAHQKLLNEGLFDTGIVAFTGKGSETISHAYAPYDNLCVNVSLKASGTVDKEIVASIAEAYTLENEGLERAVQIFESPSLMLATFTITEKGYARASYEKDLIASPEDASTLLGQVAYLLMRRMTSCGAPVSLVSMDNCSANGDKLKLAMLEIARAWNNAELFSFIENSVAFPWTMIDKITPRPDSRVQDMLEDDGFENIAPVVTSRGTYVAPFVNAEEKEYLVIEDDFPNGKPPLDKAGMYFASRETVSMVEKMKVTVCLNPLHTALAVFGCLLGYDAIWKETNDAELGKLIRAIGYDEGLPVSPDPVIFSPRSFLDEVVNDRLPNSFLPDTPQRIATDTSQKLAVRFGETIKAYVERYGSAERLTGIPLAIAGWLRYLRGTDDNLIPIGLSADPRLDELTARAPEDILTDASIFGTNLVKAGLYDKILNYYHEMIMGKGAVRETLKRALN